MKLARYLANLGYGSRREVEWLLEQRRVRHADGRVLTATGMAPHADILVDGEPLDPPPGSVLAFHKPVGYVTSTKDTAPLIYELLPPRFRFRTPVMAAVGRLDRDTSGLLLLTDDGAFNHRVTSPRHHVAKRYDVTLASALRGDEASLLASGTLMLQSEEEPLAPAHTIVIDATHVQVIVTEGRYHQVRRMFAALGNHVLSLHRSAIGALEIGSLPVGSWRVLTEQERAMVFASPHTTP